MSDQPMPRLMSFWREQRGLVLWAAISLIAYVGLLSVHLRYGTLRAEHTPESLAWYGLAFVAFVGAIIWSARADRVSGWLIWIPAIAFRFLLLFTSPTLSDDVYRYLWDGAIANLGISPYAFAIDAPELAHLDIPIRALANHPWMASPYLHAAQWLFGGVTLWLPLHPVSMQATMVVVDLLAAGLIAALLYRARLPVRHVLIYLWCPLVVVEVAHGAHVDAYMILLMLLAVTLAMTEDQRLRTQSDASDESSTFKLQAFNLYLLSPIVLALATLTKPLPFLIVPILFWRWRWRGLLVYLLTLAIVLLPAGLGAGWGLRGPLDGRGVFGALRIYGDQWNFNSGIYHWLEVGFRDWGATTPDRWAKMVVGLAMLAVLVYVWRASRPVRFGKPDRSNRRELRLMAAPFAAYILLTTTVHPWYMLALLAFIPFLAPAPVENPNRWLLLAPWLYLSAAVALSYLTYLDPQNFRELEWVRRAEWLPVLALLALTTLLAIRGKFPST